MSREIPLDLLPLRMAKVNTNWAIKTFKYYMYFNHNIKNDHYETSVDVSNWLKEAKSIIKEISKNGLDRAKDEIVRLAQFKYKLVTINGTKICNWEDVLQLFKSEEWYNKDIDRSREMVYDFKFGIFRVVGNAWAEKAVQHWMTRYDISYDGNEEIGNKKGCFMKIIMGRASDTIGEAWNRCGLRHLGETIHVRRKQKEHGVYTKRKFGCYYDGYILQNKTQENENVKRIIERLVMVAKDDNLDCNDICTRITETWEKEGKLNIETEFV